MIKTHQEQIDDLWKVIHAKNQALDKQDQLIKELKKNIMLMEREDMEKAQRIIDMDSIIKSLNAQVFKQRPNILQ